MTGVVADLLGRLGARAVDAWLGLPHAATPLEVRRDIAVPMPDGVVLLGDLHRPVGSPDAMPVVLIRLPYGRRGSNGYLLGATLSRHGFQVFIQSTRGTFGSGGHFRPFATEREDGLATLDWLREQPWCYGRVAMTGGSYFGHTQWAVVPYADPAPVAFSPHVTAAEVTRSFFQNGAPALENAVAWTTELGLQERRDLASRLPTPMLKARIRRAQTTLPLQTADVAVVGTPVAFWRDFVAHPAPDPFWDPADHSRVDMRGLPPANMVTGWWDVFLPGQLADFGALRAAGNEARILVGPWLHGEFGEMKQILARDIGWLDHHLNGVPAPHDAPVRVWLQRAGRWLDLEEWPPATSTEVAHYLRVDGTLSTEPEPGGPEAGAAAPSRFVYDPADPTPGVGGPLLKAPGKQADNRPVEGRPDVLVFTGPELPADVDVVGPVRARIFVRTDVPYADIYVRLCDVEPTGRSLNVVDGIRRLDPATVPALDVEVGEDDILAVDVELFPTAYRFRAGHRLRVQVSGGAFPRFARNLGTPTAFAVATSGVPRRFEIFHDGAHASSLTLQRYE